MAVVDPQSTTFQRSEAWRIATERDRLRWRQQWVPYAQHLRPPQARRDRVRGRRLRQPRGRGLGSDGKGLADATPRPRSWPARRAAARGPSDADARPRSSAAPPSRSSWPRTCCSRASAPCCARARSSCSRWRWRRCCRKQRILEIYLNSVEWGEGVFGAEAAAQHYFRKPASQLSAYEAARLAVMLPRPKYFEKRPDSGYLASRARHDRGAHAARGVALTALPRHPRGGGDQCFHLAAESGSPGFPPSRE